MRPETPGTDRPALLILADDLTGANDAGAQFAKRGIPSIVFVEPNLVGLPGGYEVVVVNTESRHLPAGFAAERVRRVAEIGMRHGVRHFFKKTDSTLRGNIGAELEALRKITGIRTIPFVPAFPETGRTTRGGVHYVHGKRIAETEFARDPRSPVTESDVAAVLRSTCRMNVSSAGVGFADDLADGCVVLDCESRNEMAGIARQLAEAGRLRVLAGSAAFAEQLPGVLRLRAGVLPRICPGIPVLLVNGSLNPKSLEQISRAEGLFAALELPPALILSRTDCRDFRLPAEIAPDSDLLLFSARNRHEAERYQTHAARHFGIPESELAATVATNTGQLVKNILKQHQTGSLVVFGGDTLQGIARACGWDAFIPCGEIVPGVTVATPQGSRLTVISKAGGFGEEDVVRGIVRWIRERSKAGTQL